MKTTRAYANGMKRFAAFLLAPAIAAALAAACREEPREGELMTVASHRQDVEQWQQRRDQRLRAEESWLTLVGLHWLNEGANTIAIPRSEPVTLVRNGDRIVLQSGTGLTVEGKPVQLPLELRSDASEDGPTIVEKGAVRFNVIKRGERYALRVKDAESPTRTRFAGLEYYPIDPKWRVEARLEPYDPPKQIPIDDITGLRSTSVSPGALVFTIDGKEYRIDPVLEKGTDEYFLIFKDATSRDTTYPAGRYLYTPPADEHGRVVIDFNKAYNPPCAFTDFATCPLPPPQNRLPVRIEAGEKKYAAASH